MAGKQSPRPRAAWRWASLAFGGALTLSLASTALTQNNPQKPQKNGDSLSEKLGGEDRATAHLSTDKPIYKPGETVYIRGVLLDAFSHAPVASNPNNAWQQQAFVEVRSPLDAVVAGGSANLENGAYGFKWEIPKAQDGGDYTIKLSFPQGGYAPVEREFNIRAYRAKRFRTQIEFAREGYGPGDSVLATMDIKRTEGEVPAGAPVTVIARVDGTEVHRSQMEVPANGIVTARFDLPETIAFGDGTLTFSVDDGGVESASKTIPILLQHVTLQVFPEGGDLVGGVENRVYFEATAPNGRPADIVAELRTASGIVIDRAESEHEGRGTFTFTPKAGEEYVLAVIEPWTVTTTAKLPVAQREGVVLRATQTKYGPAEPVELHVASAHHQSVEIVLSQREKRLAAQGFTLTPDRPQTVRLQVPDGVSGVLRATVMTRGQGSELPLAERLVFVEPERRLVINVTPDNTAKTPASKVSLKVTTTDQNGKPLPATVGLTVTDDGTLEMVEDRQKAPRLPAMVFLENEVEDLADAQVYLSDSEEAPQALDLLLGTQGWRRFAYVNVDQFLSNHGDAAKRALAMREQRVYYPKSGRMEMRLDAMAVGAAGAVPPQPMAAQAAPFAAEGMVQEENEALGMDDGMDPFMELAAEAPEEPRAIAEKKDEAFAQDMAEPALAREAALFDEDFAGPERRRQLAASRIAQPYPSGSGVVAVRVYAHKTRENRLPDDRTDFAETVYWNAGLRTDANGEATVEFDLSDSITTFRVMADGYGDKGAIGASDAEIESRRPLSLRVRPPLEVTAGDTIRIPVTIANEQDTARDVAITASVTGADLGEDVPESVRVAAGERATFYLPVTIPAKPGEAEVLVTISDGENKDSVTQMMPIASRGFPVSIAEGGLLNGKSTHTITIPASVLDGTVKAKIEAYPSPLANMTSALEALIRDPYGCFEQTSSTNYPLVMVCQYLESHAGADPALLKEAREKLDAGYKRLVSFETKEDGFEWFGSTPPHEALTAYGLMEFVDMAQVYPVDPALIDRTADWLLSRRDGQGGFKRDPKALDSFGRAPEEHTDAYITWCLTGTGRPAADFETELQKAIERARTTGDPYIVALVADSLQNAGRSADAKPLMQRLAAMQDKDGAVTGADATITMSGGISRTMETTSLAVLAWLDDPAYAANVEKAMKWIAEQCEGGSFGSTQGTVLALKAIIAYDTARAKPDAPGTIRLIADGNPIGEVSFEAGAEKPLLLPDIAGLLSPGAHTITLEMDGGSAMPYAIEIGFHADTPENSGDCPIDLVTEIADKTLAVGETTEITAVVTNTADKGQPMTMAIVGMPGGLEPRIERLQELRDEGRFAAYELRGRDVVLYWRDMAPNASVEIPISATATTPGTTTGPASRTYLYYTPEAKIWREGIVVTITE
ncbi:MAG: MG2 domain-containing protein [Sumerlaeia bacterium]